MSDAEQPIGPPDLSGLADKWIEQRQSWNAAKLAANPTTSYLAGFRARLGLPRLGGTELDSANTEVELESETDGAPGGPPSGDI